MNENSPRAMPPTNNAAPVHTSGLFVCLVGARSSCCCCCAAFAMLSCKSPANADALMAKTRSAMAAVLRYVMRFSLFVSSGPPVGTVSDRAGVGRSKDRPLPSNLRAELHSARRDVSRRDAERRRGAERRSNRLVLIAVGQVERVDEDVEPDRASVQREFLLHARIEQIDGGHAARAGVRLHVDLNGGREAESTDAHLARVEAAGLVL